MWRLPSECTRQLNLLANVRPDGMDEFTAHPKPPPHGESLKLQPINSGQRQQPLQDRCEADQHHEQLQQVCQSAVSDKLVDGPKADRAHDDGDQNADEK
jgi:hypothetical protein